MTQVLIPRKSPIINRPDGVPVLNRDSPQAQGLVGWWPLMGDFRDYSGRALDGVSDLSNPNVIDTIGRMTNFAATERVTIQPFYTFGGTQPISFCAWVRLLTLANDAWLIEGFNADVVLRMRAGTTIDFILNDFSSNDRATTGSGVHAAGELHHVIGSYDGTDIKVFVDGQEEATATPTGTYSNPTEWELGNNDANRDIVGHMTDVRIYNTGVEHLAEQMFYNPWDLYWRSRKLVVVSVPSAGAATQNISGSLHQDSDTLYHGLVEPGTANINSSLLQDTDNLYHGEIVRLLQQAFNNLLENENILYHGIITHNLTNSLLQDVDILHHGAITYNINNSLFQDEDILYHGEFNVSIGGSLLDDGDIFYHSVVIGNNSIEGTFLEDVDVVYHGKINHSILGHFLEDADTLNHGFISMDLQSTEFVDEDIFYHGSIFSGNVSGSLYQDPDIFYHGLISGGAQTGVLFRLLLNHLLNSNADFVDLADEITLQEQGATAETTDHIGILIDEETV